MTTIYNPPSDPYDDEITCPECRGRDDECWVCGGSGETTREHLRSIEYGACE